VGRVSYNCLVVISDSNLDVAFGVGDRTQVSKMTIAADPDGWTLWQGPADRRIQPFVEFKGAATDIRMSGAGHLQSATLRQYGLPALRQANSCARWHQLIIRVGQANA
jgi:hypothetical protein